MIGRTQGYLAATASVLIFGACSDPEESTDLRPSGAPEVLTVLVATSDDGVLEGATFCKPNDDKRPGLVPANPDGPSQVCSDDLAMGADKVEDTVPIGWYVRIQFDELLNPDIEELLPIPGSDLMEGSLAKSQPVLLSCGGVNVPYDGYYNPSGNSFTWPLGPSLFIGPDPAAVAAIPTGSDCTLMLKPDVILDKDGEKVPQAQVGPYTFKIAEMALVSTDPGAPDDPTDPDKVAPEDPLVLTFNAQVDVASLDPAEVVIREVASCDDTGGTARTAKIAAVAKDLTSIQISDAGAVDAAFEPSKTYVITFAAGAQVTQDIASGGTVDLAPDDFKPICFKTDMLSP